VFLERLVHPAVAIVISVTAVLFFGEIFPQAICTRYGLAIGANLFWFVWFLIGVTFPISFPIAFLLDCFIPDESGALFRRAGLCFFFVVFFLFSF